MKKHGRGIDSESTEAFLLKKKLRSRQSAKEMSSEGLCCYLMEARNEKEQLRESEDQAIIIIK